jgi:hypothetical protein
MSPMVEEEEEEVVLVEKILLNFFTYLLDIVNIEPD